MMTEWENPKIYESGYGPDIEVIRLDLYRLLNQFIASKRLSELCEDDPYLNHAMYSLDHFFEIETTRILLSSAVIARVVDDRDKYLKDYNTKCGKLIEDLQREDVLKDLYLREACNKIIHAKTVRYDVEVERHGYDQRLFNPYMYYYGTYKGKQWKAILNVIEYVKVFTDNVV
jgi:hypothetical protein